jgi:hypothetical protein
MRFLLWLALVFLISMPNAFAEDVDFDKLARPERAELAKCFSDTLTLMKKYQLSGLYLVLDAACAVEIERVRTAAEDQLTEPDQPAVESVFDLFKRR